MAIYRSRVAVRQVGRGALVIALALSAILSGCGGGSDAVTTTSAEEQLEELAEGLKDAAVDGEWQRLRLEFVTSCIEAGGPPMSCECAATELEEYPYEDRPKIAGTPSDERFQRIQRECAPG